MTAPFVLKRSEGMRVLKAAAKRHGIPWGRIVARYQNPALVVVRREVALELAALGWSTPQIGKFLQRDHSTIVDLMARAEQWADEVAA